MTTKGGLPMSETDIDARFWHPWFRINRVLRVMLHIRWSAEQWSVTDAV